MDYRRIIGYEKIDNMLTGFLIGLLSIAIAYLLQDSFYNISALGSWGSGIKLDMLKLSLLGGLFSFLVLNYLDKVFAMKGVLMAVILMASYLVYKIYWS
jgi:energy-converting hydrogenase Eha subunit A